MFKIKTTFIMRLLTLLVAVTVMATLAAGHAEAARKKNSGKKQTVDRYASIVIDAETGFALSEKNADKRLYPASLTKMMTLYLAFEALDKGKLRKNDRLPVSRRAAAQEPSKLDLQPGTTIRVEDAILALVTKSANDVAVVLAEKLGGSEAGFARIMTQKAQNLGMNNTRFANASGLHNPAQYSTARDMARLGQALLQDFPRHYSYFSARSFTYAGRTYNNHNHLMKTYNGMDGIKTGYVGASGFNLVASAKRGNQRLIGVVFGGRTSKSRNDHMQDLLDTAFERVREPRIAGLIQKRKEALATRNVPANSATRVTQTAYAAQAQALQPAAGFNALSLVDDEIAEGDTDEDIVFENRKVSLSDTKTISEFRPRPLNTQPIKKETKVATLTPPLPKPSSGARDGGWAVQVGAFSSHDAGMAALHSARRKLPAHIASRTEYAIVPLMTNRGMIYRARMTQLDRDLAAQACRVLQENCLILATQ